MKHNLVNFTRGSQLLGHFGFMFAAGLKGPLLVTLAVFLGLSWWQVARSWVAIPRPNAAWRCRRHALVSPGNMTGPDWRRKTRSHKQATPRPRTRIRASACIESSSLVTGAGKGR